MNKKEKEKKLKAEQRIDLEQLDAGLLRVLRGPVLLVDVRGRRLQVLIVRQRRLGIFDPRYCSSSSISDGGEEQSMDDDVSVSSNGGSEVSVEAEGESVVEEAVLGDASGGEIGCN